MIQVEIPNSVSEYKAKFIAGLTGKQVALICFAGFAISDYPYPYIWGIVTGLLDVLPLKVTAVLF